MIENLFRKMKKHSLSTLPKSGTESKAFFRAEAQKGNFVVKIDTKQNEKERTEKVAVSRHGLTFHNKTFLKHAFALIEKRKGYSYFRFGNDPRFCKRKKRRRPRCFAKGNVENMRENFVNFGLREVLDIPSNNNAPFRLLWELANEADGNNFSDYKKLKSFQKINHFPGVRELGNKRKLQRNMRNAVNKYGFAVFDVFPLSFRVPKEKLLFENMHRKLVALSERGRCAQTKYIMDFKDIGERQGRRYTIDTKSKRVKETERYSPAIY